MHISLRKIFVTPIGEALFSIILHKLVLVLIVYFCTKGSCKTKNEVILDTSTKGLFTFVVALKKR